MKDDRVTTWETNTPVHNYLDAGGGGIAIFVLRREGAPRVVVRSGGDMPQTITELAALEVGLERAIAAFGRAYEIDAEIIRGAIDEAKPILRDATSAAVRIVPRATKGPTP